MKRKAILSLMLVAVLMIGASLGTYAWFTSSATSEDNTFTAGTLRIDVNESLEHNGVFNILEVNGLMPNQETEEFTINITNKGTSPLAMFRKFNYGGHELLAKNLIVTKFEVTDWSINYNNGGYGSVDILDTNYNKEKWNAVGDDDELTISLYDLAKAPMEEGNGYNMIGLTTDHYQEIKIQFKLRETAPNEVQGATATLMMDVKATQAEIEAIDELELGTKTTASAFVTRANEHFAKLGYMTTPNR